jgi:hypothetical protein
MGSCTYAKQVNARIADLQCFCLIRRLCQVLKLDRALILPEELNPTGADLMMAWPVQIALATLIWLKNAGAFGWTAPDFIGTR